MLQIPIVLSDETELQGSATTNKDSVVSRNTLFLFLIPSEQIYEHSNGEKIDLLTITANRNKPNKFVLNALDRIFKDENDLINMDVHDFDTDNRITVIRG